MAMIGILAGISVLGLIALVVASVVTGPSREKRETENAAYLADAAAHDAAEKAAKEAELRKQCKVPEAGAIFIAYSDQMRDRCHDLIRDSLKVPGSSDFASESDEMKDWVSYDGCSKTYRSYFDAKNAFGVKVRTRYECTFDPRTGLYSTKVQP